MQLISIAVLTLFLGACATVQSRSPAVSILVDLDPASADRTVIVESITADKDGRLYLPDRVTGNILRVDPKTPKPVVVGRIEAREITGKKVNADGAGIAFNQQGDLFVAVGPFGEVVRVRGSDLNPAKPGVAQTFATGTAGANGIAFESSTASAQVGVPPNRRFKSKSTRALFRTVRHSRRPLPTGWHLMPKAYCTLPILRGARFGRW